jgi:hypothetical protein
MSTTQVYRSVFTGAEIDQAISEMRGALSAQLISNDFTGGTGKIASAELAKILNNNIIANNQPANIRSQLTSIPDSHVLTDAEYSKFNYLGGTSSFRGVFTNAANRDTTIGPEYAHYLGNEVSFLADDGSGDNLSEFSRWDVPTSTWKKVQLYNAGGTPPQVIATASATNLFYFRKARYTAMKCLVAVCDAAGANRQIQEVLITFVVNDTYISVYNEIGNSQTLFNLTTAIDANNVYVVVNTTAANLTVTGKILAMI